MASSRYVNTNFWRDNYIVDLDPSEKLLFLYFLTNPNTTIAGVYEINIRQIAFDTGFDRDMIQKILDRFMRDGKMWYRDGWLILRNFVKHQRINPSVRQGIEREISRSPQWLQAIVTLEETDGQLTLTVSSHTEVEDSLSTVSPQTGTPYLTLPYLTLPNSTLPNANVGEPTPRPERIPTELITEMLQYWETVVGMKLGNETGNRKAVAALLRVHKREELERMVQGVMLAMDDQYAPRISDFVDLKKKWNALIVWGRKKGTANANSRF